MTSKGKQLVKGFGFVSDAAEREYKEFSKEILQVFGTSLRAIQEGKRPFIPTKNISESVGKGAIELIIQGSPAKRCVYVAKYENTVFVLHTFEKTTDGVDKQAMKVAKLRYKELMAELRKLK